MVFAAIRDFFEQRRFRKDLRKMHSLTESFVYSVHNLAKKGGYEDALSPMEVLVLATFVVTELYLGFSRDKAFASDMLDEFHKFAAEWLFNLNLASLQDKFPNRDVGAMYDQFVISFYDKTKERYVEYRSIMLDENGLFKFSDRHFSEIGKHLLKPSSKIDGEARKVITFAFGVAVLDHMSRCGKSFKH